MSGDFFIQWNVPPAVRMYTPVADRSSESESSQSAAWARYLQQYPDAWNGPLLRLVEADESGLTVAPGWYCDYVEARDPESTSDSIFVAVSGVLSVDKAYVLGRRAAGTSDPGTWEFAPAGGLQELPLGKQLTVEIEEELGLDARFFHVLSPVGMFVNQIGNIADVIIPVEVEVSGLEVLEAFVPGEYDEIEVMSAPEIIKHVREMDSPSGLLACVIQLIENGAL